MAQLKQDVVGNVDDVIARGKPQRCQPFLQPRRGRPDGDAADQPRDVTRAARGVLNVKPRQRLGSFAAFNFTFTERNRRQRKLRAGSRGDLARQAHHALAIAAVAGDFNVKDNVAIDLFGVFHRKADVGQDLGDLFRRGVDLDVVFEPA